jgi:hypothetical protein
VSDEVRLRRAEPGDLDFLVELMTHEEVEPFMAVIRPRDPEAMGAEIERSLAEPEEFGRFVIEVDGRPAGTCSSSSATTGSSSRSTASTSARSTMPSAPASCGKACAARPTTATASGWTV